MSKLLRTFVCQQCNELFTTTRTKGTYCSHACRNAALKAAKVAQRQAWPIVTCQECGEKFQRPGWYGKAKNPFCSPDCWYKFFRENPEAGGKWKVPRQVCTGCGATFKAKRRYRRQFCSDSCYRRYNVGKNHSHWKHGRKLMPNGYVQINVAPNKRRYEHIVVVEKMIGRPLRADECIDHINGIRDDNRPENLRVMKKSDHAKMHMAMFKKPPVKSLGSGDRTTPGSMRFRSLPAGTKKVRRDGYILIKTRSGWKLEHRLVTARMLGRPLSRSKVIHHRDGNKAHNSPNNLEVMAQDSHILIAKPHRNSPVTKRRRREST